jgi:ABC-2 type transport system ATP-binding protein
VSSGSALAIETRKLTRRYGDRNAVDALDLRVRQGSVFGFLGPNGAGKSTTLKLLCGQLAPTSGEAIVAGLSSSRDAARLKEVIGFMPQAFGLYDYLTVAENLAFYADLYLSSRGAAKRRVQEVIELTGLEKRLDQPAEALSGGWKQRLALGCAILHRPRVLFLDEPTAGVDAVARRVFWDLLFRLNEEGTTLFVTTHYMEELDRCHEVGILAAGQLRALGPPRALKETVAQGHELLSVVTAEPEVALAALRGLRGLRDSYVWGEEIRLTWRRGAQGELRTRALLEELGLRDALVELRPPTMEDVLVASQEAQ